MEGGKDRKPLVIKGIRQCGKTYIVQKFAKEHYENVVYMNFILEPDKKSAFTGNIDVDTIILNLSALIPGSRFINGKTCIILDEIQECKEARTALKSFHIDGRFDVIATGSLLGVKGYGKSKKKTRKRDKIPYLWDMKRLLICTPWILRNFFGQMVSMMQ